MISDAVNLYFSVDRVQKKETVLESLSEILVILAQLYYHDEQTDTRTVGRISCDSI